MGKFMKNIHINARGRENSLLKIFVITLQLTFLKINYLF